MPRKKLKPMVLENYLTIAKMSAESPIFRKLYCKKNGRRVDILHDGDLSCAFFVSVILKCFDLISKIHTTVVGAERELELNGWRKIKKPKPGAVIIWAPKKFEDGEVHRHIGIFLGAGEAISNNNRTRSPQIHIWNNRPVEKILWNKKLE